jgi:3-dehydroquinate synthase
VLVGGGLLTELPSLLQRYCPARRYVIITDSHVAGHYGERLRETLAGTLDIMLVKFPAGEWNKTRETWSMLTDRMLEAGVGRDGAVIALGGGVTGDVGGFVAATYHRGMPYVQVPTTLLAMIDSSVGGKTGVDTVTGQNLVGAFHQPRAVFADVDTLATLPRAQLVAGMAEALKHGAIADGRYFDTLLARRDALLALDRDALAEAVIRSVQIKAEVVAEDERETGRRAVLNFGHTIGHAVEAVGGYKIAHGEAVAIGMRAEAELGVRLGVTDASECARLASGLQAFGLPVSIPVDLPAARLVDAMRHDKKVRGGVVHVTLMRRVGETARGARGEWTSAVDETAINAALAASR